MAQLFTTYPTKIIAVGVLHGSMPLWFTRFIMIMEVHCLLVAQYGSTLTMPMSCVGALQLSVCTL